MYASFNRFELELTEEQAHMGSHQGACDESELKDHEANKARILWIAAGDIVAELPTPNKII